MARAPRRRSTSIESAQSGGKFDPLRLDVLSQNLRSALDQRPRTSLPPPDRFNGPGLYALYYTGPLKLYAALKDHNVPIYVGKAEAGNSSYGDPASEDKPKLYNRIRKHEQSIREVADNGGNLKAEHFEVRYLLLDDVWIVLGERALLRAYAPVLWNALMPGFGANEPGSGRKNARSIWDTIHPGRPRAGKVCNRRFTRSEMEDRITRGIAISLMPPGDDRDAALRGLMRENPQWIWSPSKKNDPDQRMRVYRPDVFISENRDIHSWVTPKDWYDATGQEGEALPDPEQAAEENVRSAEQMESGDEEE